MKKNRKYSLVEKTVSLPCDLHMLSMVCVQEAETGGY